MSTVMVEKFAARHGVAPNVICQPDGSYGQTMQSGALQNDLSHFERGWSAYQDLPVLEAESAEQACAMAHERYEKMVRWNASMGAISREEYVAGFVAAAGF